MNINKKYTFIIFAVLIISGLALAASIFFEKQRIDKSYSQLAYIRWAGKESVSSYSQLSVFFDKTTGPTQDSIREIRNKINQKLREDSLLNSDSNGRTWIDAYSAEKTISIRKDSNTVTVEAYLIGGDFFQIHPIKLKKGNYPQNQKNQILLDENVAWNIFGSSNVEGKKIWINDKVYTVTGVAEYDDTKLSRTAIGNKDTVYLPYEAYLESQKKPESKITDRFDNESEKDASGYNKENILRITCYEAVLPNPISNYGLNVVAEANDIEFLSDEELEKQRSILLFDDKEILDNSVRYQIPSLISRIRERRYVDMKTNGISYPYWENMARFEETRCINIMTAGCILFILLLIFIISLISKNTTRY